MAPLTPRYTCIKRLYCHKVSMGVTLLLRQGCTAQVWTTPPVWCDVIAISPTTLGVYRWWVLGSTQDNCCGLMNYTIEISRTGIYNTRYNNKYNLCPEFSQSGPGTTFPELEFEMCTNLYTGTYIIFVWFNETLAADMCLFYCPGHTTNMNGNGENTF